MEHLTKDKSCFRRDAVDPITGILAIPMPAHPLPVHHTMHHHHMEIPAPVVPMPVTLSAVPMSSGYGSNHHPSSQSSQQQSHMNPMSHHSNAMQQQMHHQHQSNQHHQPMPPQHMQQHQHSHNQHPGQHNVTLQQLQAMSHQLLPMHITHHHPVIPEPAIRKRKADGSLSPLHSPPRSPRKATLMEQSFI